MYYEGCHINLGKNCVEIHLSDSSIVYQVVSLKQYLSTLTYPKCMKQPTKQCKLYCKQCEIAICTKCILSRKHSGHKNVDNLQTFKRKTQFLQKQLQEYKSSIYSEYKLKRLHASQFRRLIWVNTPQNWQPPSKNKEKSSTEK